MDEWGLLRRKISIGGSMTRSDLASSIKVLAEMDRVIEEKDKMLYEKELRIEQLIKQLEMAGIQPE